jgi:putative transposase
MARLPRLVIPFQAHHVTQCGIDRQPIFRDDADHLAFLGWLRSAAKQFKVALHAYVLMQDHIQLLLSPSDVDGLGRMMQWIGRLYVPYFNQKYGRAGTLWQGRFKASVIDSEAYFMLCSRYIELDPVRANLVADPGDYRWSSYAHHSGAQADNLITDHPLYWALGNTPFEREAAYKELARQPLGLDEINTLNLAVPKGWALGSDRFKKNLEKRILRRVSPAKRGRPAKKSQPPDSSV